MTATTYANPSEDLVLVVTRIFDAPRELVFKIFTDPKHLARFWGPTGFTSNVREMDPRPGGAFCIDMRGPDGGICPCKGVYCEVVEPKRIVYIGEPDGSHGCGGGLPPRALVRSPLPGTMARRFSRSTRASRRPRIATRQLRWGSIRVGPRAWTASRIFSRNSDRKTRRARRRVRPMLVVSKSFAMIEC
jgi:uncharacterized protein YndB with AHSA1/START domain